MNRRSFLGVLGGALAAVPATGMAAGTLPSDGSPLRVDEWDEPLGSNTLRRIHLETAEPGVVIGVFFRRDDGRTWLVPLTDDGDLEERLSRVQEFEFEDRYYLHVSHKRGPDGPEVHGVAVLTIEPSVENMYLTVPVRLTVGGVQ